jgi:hypothetical protein
MELQEKSAENNVAIIETKTIAGNVNKTQPKSITKEEGFEIFHSIFVRILFILEAIVLLLFVICIVKSYYYIFLIPFLLVIIADGFYVVIKRKGKEYKWFSISVASFSIIFIVSAWVLVFYKLNVRDPSCQNSTLTSFTNGDFCFSVCYTISIR